MGWSAKNWFQVIVMLLTFLLGAFFLWNFRSSFSSISNQVMSNLHLVGALLLLFSFMYFLVGLSLREILKSFGIRISSNEAFGISSMTGFYNLISPFKGGLAARALYLNKKHSLPYTDFMVTLAASYVPVFAVASVLGLFAIVSIGIWSSGSGALLFWALFAVLGISASVAVFAPYFSSSPHPWVDRVVRVVNGWHELRSDLRLVYLLSILGFFQIIVSTLMMKLQFLVVGVEITFIEALLLAALGSLSIIISITPAGLGITEGVTVFTALALSLPAAESIAAAVLGRVVSVVALFILGPLYSYFLIRD